MIVPPMMTGFLTTIGKRFGIDAHYLAKNSFIVSSSYVISILRGLITGYLVARLFPRELYGQYQLILSVVGTLSVFGLPDLSKAVSRAVAHGNPGMVRTVAKIHAVLCLLGSVVLLSGIAILPFFNRMDLWPLLIAAAVLFPLGPVSTTLFGGLTVGEGTFSKAFQANLVWSILMIVWTVLVLLTYPSPLLMLIGVKAIPALVFLGFGLMMVRGIKPASKEEAKPVLKYGIGLTLLNLPLSLSSYLDGLLVSAFFGINQMAVFSVALLIPEQFKVWAGELLPITFSRQARGDDSMKRRYRLMRQVLFLACIFACGITAYIVAAPLIFKYLFPQYPDAVFLSQIAAVILVTVPGGLLTQYMEAQAMLKALTWTRWISVIVFVTSLLLLVPTMNLIGALIARGLLRMTYLLVTIGCLLWMKPVRE